MEDIILEIIERLRAGQTLTAKDLLRILNDHNKRLHDRARTTAPAILASPRPYSKKKLLPFYLRTKQRDPERWRSWNITPQLEQQLIALLQVKPRRSASGVATITVITKPWKCANACIYCPNDLRMPKSYLSDEPACQRAERNYFDPYLQVVSRLRALDQMGHVTDKIELIVLGGSWSDYPKSYQIWFITELFRALNDAGISASADHEAPSTCTDSRSIIPGDSLVDQRIQAHIAAEAITDQEARTQADPESRADQEARVRRRLYKAHGLSYEKDDLIAFTRKQQSLVDEGQLSYNAAMVELYEPGEPWVSLARTHHATLAQLPREPQRNEHAQHRVVGLVVETRPNAVTPKTLTFLRSLGATKLQMGIQSLDQRIHDLNHRPVTIAQIDRALDLARLFGFKTHTHFMVNLLGSTPESDKEDFRRFVTEPPYQPDEIKLYPCALVKGTELCARYEAGEWQPYDEETLIDVLVADELATPPFTRISRMIRDFSAHDIEAGNKKVNLRQLVEARAEAIASSHDNASDHQAIQEIRYREISTQDVEIEELFLDAVPYETTSTREVFLQWVTPKNKIAGFLRLSLPKPEAFTTYQNLLQTCPDEAMIREVHVYGRASSLHESGSYAQHRGLGKKLIERACAIAKAQGFRKINVISAIGTRQYYRTLGFEDNGLYQQKLL